MPPPPDDQLRAAAFEGEILPRGGLRTNLDQLRTPLDNIDAALPRAEIDRLLDAPAVEGVEAAGALLEAYGGVVESAPERSADRRWLSRAKLSDEHVRDAFDVLLVAGLVSRLDTIPKDFGALVTRLMFGSDPTTTLFRDVLLGKPVPEDEGLPWEEPPGGSVIPFDELEQGGCVAAVQDSLAQIGVAAAGLPRPHPRAGAVITSIAPNPATTGETVVIRGTGLGVSDPTTSLMFGKKTAMTTLWTDTEIHAVVPQVEGECCVSIVEQAVAVGDNIGLLLEATAELSGTLGQCFGPAGAAAGAKLGKIPFGLMAAEATCQPDRRNAMWVGPPTIEWFTANDDASGAYVWRPHKPLTLRWTVARADSVGMSAAPQAGAPPVSMTPFVSSDALPRGSQSFAPLDSVIPWRMRYTLRATNRCGTSRADLDVQFLARIGVIAASGGLRCSFQLGALTAMGGLVETEPSVYGASGFGALSVRAAAANFRSMQPLRDFWEMLTTPDDFFAADAVVNQLTTVDGAKYKGFLTSARESSAIMALGFGAHGGSYLPIPEVNFGEIWWRNGLALAQGMTAEAGSEVGSMVADSVLAAGEGAAESFPWLALIVFALKVGVEFGVATDVHNKIAAALAEKGVKNPAALMSGIDDLVTNAGPVRSGVKLRIALGNLESGDVNYANEVGTIVAQPLGSQVSSGSLSQTLKASVSTPSFLPPVKIGTKHFVDGATIDPAPLDAVVDAGADHVYVLQPNPRLLVPIDTFDDLGFLHAERRALQMRERGFLSASLAPHELWQRRENGVRVVGDLRIGVDLIEATIDLTGHDAFTADKGLIALWSDYGYMRAFDVIAPTTLFPDESQRDDRATLARQLAGNSDNITAARYFCWSVEHDLNGSLRVWTQLSPDTEIVPVSAPDGAVDMRSTKRAIRVLIDQRLRLVHDAPRTKGGRFPPVAAVPSTYADWFMKWEQHYWSEWNILGANPWAVLGAWGDGSGDVAAETPPAAIDPALLQP
jgi:Patatin-like phospholipase/IPT/TIG domain